MAAVVLTTIGTAVGGSVGGALGGLIGQSLDRGLFGSGTRKGPRLGDLTVQTSTFGSPIPQIYGAMRVAGTVVWATDLIEEEVIEGGGKGSPERLTYSYSANLAVALSSRPIIAIRRIWADGKLIRGANGNFKVRTGFRIAFGGPDQDPDPLIAAAEGIDNAPGYRGLALAIFEGLDLAEFGNRIPLFTFEVIADNDPMPLSVLLYEASNGLIDVQDIDPISGFAAHGTSIRDSLNHLMELGGVSVVEDSGRLRSPEVLAPLPIADQELGCDADGPGRTKLMLRRAPDGEMPAKLTLAYYDPNRDYQVGQAMASSGGGGVRQTRLELPAVLPAGQARRLAELALARQWLAGETVTLRLPPTRMSMRPGDVLRLAGAPRPWWARSVSIEGMAVVVEAEPTPVVIEDLPADPGRPVSEPDIAIGRSQLLLFELPSEGGAIAGSPVAYVAASNEGQWKSLPVELAIGDQPLAGVAIGRRSILGHAEAALSPATFYLVDELSEVVVQTASSQDVLLNVDWDALAAGANLALIGDELIQFGRAEQVGDRSFRLSKLFRGQHGTEWAAANHVAGERFCMINPGRLKSVPLNAGHVGAVLRAVAHGVADLAPLPQASRSISGEAMRPPSPCHLKVTRAGAVILLQWVRRSHRQWAWLDGAGDGADGFPEHYRIAVEGPAGTAEFETLDCSMMLDPAQVPAESGQAVKLSVATIGATVSSHATDLTMIL